MIRYDFSLAVLNRQSDEPKTVDTTLEEITGMKRPCDERGRDYYEFKEDIHYNRYFCIFIYANHFLSHTYAKQIPFLAVLDTLMHIISKRIYDLRSLFECRTADF